MRKAIAVTVRVLTLVIIYLIVIALWLAVWVEYIQPLRAWVIVYGF